MIDDIKLQVRFYEMQSKILETFRPADDKLRISILDWIARLTDELQAIVRVDEMKREMRKEKSE
jgi:hypothetical protein